jgi:leucyl-tRNA synthetase
MYNFEEIEKKQQDLWEKNKLFLTDPRSKKKRFYMLEMLPYPSGNLHMGHVRNYSIGDAIARYKRMNGFDVFHPIGWDSFGLPAENAAIKRKISPKDWTEQNISHMRNQLKQLGFSYDWSKEVKTSSDKYYKWNQWLFKELFNKGLAYRKKAFVNWSLSLETVLSNEQVEESFCNGGKDDIVQKELTQWFFKITDYADDLIEGLDHIDWPEKVKTMQKKWIGKSEGVEVLFEVPGQEEVKVFTTRLDTIFGVTYIAISISHEISKVLSENNLKIAEYIKRSLSFKKDISNNLSRGIFTGHYAVNPVNGKRVPIFIADYVLDYGTKAVMGVPAHDSRDFNFANEHGIAIQKVLETDQSIPFEEKSILINSLDFNGLESDEAIESIYKYLEKHDMATKKINYRLKDWLISRQRYWGTPIPVVYKNDAIDLENNLPVLLPEDISFTGRGNPIETSKSFSKGRETDTMDTFVDSSWYYLRYLDNLNENEIFSKEVSFNWPQVDLYVGGVEHAVMHLLYSRFIHRVLYDLKLVPNIEPFKRLLTQGMVLSNSYYLKGENRYIFPNEAKNLDDSEIVVTLEKMSKSKNNGVSPEDMAKTYGVDAIRIFILFAAPPEKDLEWNESGIAGARRFLNRVWNLLDLVDLNYKVEITSKESDFLYKLNTTILKVTEAIDKSIALNVAIAALMELTNTLYECIDINKGVWSKGYLSLVKMLSPFAPHISDEIYQKLGHTFLIDSSWPEIEKKYLEKKNIDIPIQVNGKLRGTLSIFSNETKEKIIELAKEVVKKHLLNEPSKIIYIEKKLINFVIK